MKNEPKWSESMLLFIIQPPARAEFDQIYVTVNPDGAKTFMMSGCEAREFSSNAVAVAVHGRCLNTHHEKAQIKRLKL